MDYQPRFLALVALTVAAQASAFGLLYLFVWLNQHGYREVAEQLTYGVMTIAGAWAAAGIIAALVALTIGRRDRA